MQNHTKVDHSNVCQPMTQWETLMADPPYIAVNADINELRVARLWNDPK